MDVPFFNYCNDNVSARVGGKSGTEFAAPAAVEDVSCGWLL